MKLILKALETVKSEVGVMTKDTENPFFKSRYFDVNQLIAHLEPLFKKNGLLLLQPIESNKVKSVVYHVDSGESVSSEIDLGSITDPQKVGSAITYYRRYTLQSLLGLQAEDDDANKASEKTPNANTSSNKNEPTEWLNLFDKQGNKLKAFTDMEKAVSEGKKYTLAQIRESFKVSKVVAEELKNNFNII